MASSASDTSTAADESRPTGFRDLVFDRQRSFMVMEIKRIRDALLGSDVLIAKAEANASLNMPADVSIKDPSLDEDKVNLMFRYVDRAAFGDQLTDGQVTYRAAQPLHQSSRSTSAAPSDACATAILCRRTSSDYSKQNTGPTGWPFLTTQKVSAQVVASWTNQPRSFD